MSSTPSPPDLDLSRNPALTAVATYRRTIGASLERVWENVRDWEHLPWLHARAFAQIECTGEGEWGWRACVVYPGGGTKSNIELLIEGAESRYVTRVLDGPGADGEIWTSLQVKGERETDIVVEFLRALAPGEEADAVGAGYLGLYSMLWDDDEVMMQARQRELDRRDASAGAPPAIDLGSREALAARLPLDLEAFGGRVRVYEQAGELGVHGLVCPHRLGPLEASAEDPRVLVCPWHGYRFSRETHASCDGRRYRVANPARLVVEQTEQGEQVRLVAADG